MIRPTSRLAEWTPSDKAQAALCAGMLTLTIILASSGHEYAAFGPGAAAAISGYLLTLQRGWL